MQKSQTAIPINNLDSVKALENSEDTAAIKYRIQEPRMGSDKVYRKLSKNR